MKRQYNLFKFLFDLFMILITGGLWMLWIFYSYLKESQKEN